MQKSNSEYETRKKWKQNREHQYLLRTSQIFLFTKREVFNDQMFTSVNLVVIEEFNNGTRGEKQTKERHFLKDGDCTLYVK